MLNNNLGNLPQTQIPLLLWNSNAEKIIEDSTEPSFNYDHWHQTVEFHCLKQVGTKSLVSTTNYKKSCSDSKNGLDDTKLK